MKKVILAALLCLAFPALLIGCGKETAEAPGNMQIGNPWTQWDSLEAAEREVGFSFGLPEVIADHYTVEEIRTMNRELLEVTYRDGEHEVCVRKQEGEGQDISGDYNVYETIEESSRDGGRITSWYNSGDNARKHIVSYEGYSWSLVAPNGYREDSCGDFLNCIWDIA